MNNYLKKLAYIKRELVKLAASNEHEGLFIEMPMTYDLGFPTVDELKQRWGLEKQDNPYAKPANILPSATGPDSIVANSNSYFAPTFDPSIDAEAVGQYLSGNGVPVMGSSSARSAAPRYTQDQLDTITGYQEQLISGMMRRQPGLTREQAIKELSDRGRYYTVNNGTITGPKGFENSNRFKKILSGEKNTGNIVWSQKRGGNPFDDLNTPVQQVQSKRKNTYPVGDAGNQYGPQIPKPEMSITPPPGQNSITKK